LKDEIENKIFFTKGSRKKSEIKRMRTKVKKTTHEKLGLEDEIEKQSKLYKRTITKTRNQKNKVQIQRQNKFRSNSKYLEG
jgi:hypothetical protein